MSPTGGFLGFFPSYCILFGFICRLSDSTVSEDAGIEPWTVATSALAVRSSHQYQYLCIGVSEYELYQRINGRGRGRGRLT
jgi:hypothetical protein